MTSRQLRGRGKDMLEVWHDHIDDPDHVMEDPGDFDNLATQSYVPLLRSLADKHALPKKPAPAPIDRRISWLAATLGLDDVEQAIVSCVARYALFECWENFIDALPGRNSNCSVGRIAFASGLSPARVEARLATGSRLWSTGLIDQSHDGSISANALLSFIAGVRSGPASLPGLLMPSAPQSTLAWSDFDHLGPQRELAERLVASNEGVAILLYGPPGTGKSEFARLLASRLDRKAIFAGLSDDRGSEPSRRERIAHLSVLRALTLNDDSRIVVMDEADDILVLEEPGDREDIEGRPFVGPAGALFDRVAGAVGLDRRDAWVTNAVKHFKYTAKGRRRIHQPPNRTEIEHCRWWLDAEIAQVRPKLILGMGATAAEGLTGRREAITARRGTVEQTPSGTPVLLTLHPSYLLRLPDPQAKADATAQFQDDLAAAVRMLA